VLNGVQVHIPNNVLCSLQYILQSSASGHGVFPVL
jgi:hypothetical protein